MALADEAGDDGDDGGDEGSVEGGTSGCVLRLSRAGASLLRRSQADSASTMTEHSSSACGLRARSVDLDGGMGIMAFPFLLSRTAMAAGICNGMDEYPLGGGLQ